MEFEVNERNQMISQARSKPAKFSVARANNTVQNLVTVWTGIILTIIILLVGK